MSIVLEEIIEKIKSLPAGERRKLREMLEKGSSESQWGRQRRIELSEKIMGKYSGIATSSEDFARRKQGTSKGFPG